MHPELESQIAHIEQLDKLQIGMLKEIFLADQGNMFALDLLAAAATKRSMSLCAGFSTLVRAQNYASAASLLRLQLDSCLRFFAASIVENPHDFVIKVLEGKSIRKMKANDGSLMTDRYLVDRLGKEYEWMPSVYAATSGFIHLSERHFYMTVDTKKIDNQANKISLFIGKNDQNIPDELWIEMATGFIACTDVLFEYLKGWQFTKQNPEMVARRAL